jgi:hypothetical protein
MILVSCRLPYTELVMADEEKPKAVLNIPAFTPARTRAQTAAHLSMPMRAQEELTRIALRLAENADLMQRFRAVIGSEDKERAGEMIDEVTRLAQSLEPSITVPEGTLIVVALMKMVGHPKGDAK